MSFADFGSSIDQRARLGSKSPAVSDAGSTTSVRSDALLNDPRRRCAVDFRDSDGEAHQRDDQRDREKHRDHRRHEFDWHRRHAPGIVRASVFDPHDFPDDQRPDNLEDDRHDEHLDAGRLLEHRSRSARG